MVDQTNEDVTAARLERARAVIRLEARTIAGLEALLDGSFSRAVELLLGCPGTVVVTGMGKAGLIGQKIMATLASTGTPSHCLHPAEAVHGDLGRVHRNDVMLILSQSGETEEVGRLLPSLVKFGVPIIAITAQTARRISGQHITGGDSCAWSPASWGIR